MVSENSSQNLNRLYSELVILLDQEEQLRKETQAQLEKAKASIDPRKAFNKWLQTNEGKDWKHKQFEFQSGKCAACHDSLRFSDAVVHHVLPLKAFGAAANKPENFKLLHPGCNLSIGTKIVEFP